MAEKKSESKEITKTTSVRGLTDDYAPFAQAVEKTLFTKTTNVNIETLYEVMKKSPEVLGSVQAIIEDIMADGWRFDAETKKAVNRSKEFLLKSDFYKVLSNALFDLLVTGNAYILKLSVDADKMSSLAMNLTKALQKKFNVRITGTKRKQSMFEVIKQDFETPVDLQLLKASTIKINYDETGAVRSYEQEAHGATRIYQPKDIIHLSLINVGGGPFGFSPIEPLLSDLATLIFAKEYAGKYFENDGIPHFIFKLLEDGPDSPNVKRLKQELKELKSKDQKWRSMVITGQMEVDQLARFNKDLEFAELIQHFTQIILIALGVPAYRINYTLTSKQIGSQVNRAFEGYYKRISWLQKIIENTLNRELFSAFKSQLTFNRSYKIDEMREATIVQILTQVGAITIEEARQMMGLEPQIPEGTRPNSTGDDNRPDFDADQRDEQGRNNNPQNPQRNLDNRSKSIEKRFQNVVDVSWDQLVIIVERFVGNGAFDNAKIIYEETREAFAIYFNDGSWTYRAVVRKNELDDVDKFRFEKLRMAIRVRY